MIAIKRYAAMLLALALVACAGEPQRNEVLERARQAVATAEQNAAVVEQAPLELEQARTQLNKAIEAWKDGEDERTEHYAYLALRNAQTAEAMARAAQARQAASQAREQRQMVIVESREREAQMAREEAAQVREQLQQLQQRFAELQPEETERGLVLTLGSFLFNLDSAELKPKAQASLDKLATYLENNPDREVLIEGYTDATGPEAYNKQLSQERAEAVVRALTRRGISADRLRSVGYGERYPVASNDEPSGRAQNRRVELVINEQPPQRRDQVQAGAGQVPLSDRPQG